MYSKTQIIPSEINLNSIEIGEGEKCCKVKSKGIMHIASCDLKLVNRMVYKKKEIFVGMCKKLVW